VTYRSSVIPYLLCEGFLTTPANHVPDQLRLEQDLFPRGRADAWLQLARRGYRVNSMGCPQASPPAL
jgi:hypothetical protein